MARTERSDARRKKGGEQGGGEAGREAQSEPQSIAAVAASSVDGYLLNASRRLRVPAAEGGRGTRRKLDMVTSATAVAGIGGTVAKAEVGGGGGGEQGESGGDEEWDEVELVGSTAGMSSVKRQVAMSKSETDGGVAMKHDLVAPVAGAELPVVKPDLAGSATLGGDAVDTTSLPAVKREGGGMLGFAAEGGGGNNGEDDAATDMMPGARRPLTEQPSRPAWQRSDPAYEAMIEQRDLLAARRRSERIQRTSLAITQLLLLFWRGRLLWREAHHPRLVKRLLKMRLPVGTSTGGRVATAYVFRDAVLQAKALVAQSHAESAMQRPSLAPAWVTVGKDGVRNTTSQAILVLLHVLDKHFQLVPQRQTGSSGDGKTKSSDTAVAAEATGETTLSTDFLSSWYTPLQSGVLQRALRRCRAAGGDVTVARDKIALPHTVYFCLLFLALARLSGLDCRLVVAKEIERSTAQSRSAVTAVEGEGNVGADAEEASNAEGGDDEARAEGSGGRGQNAFLEKMSLFMKRANPRKKAPTTGETSRTKRGRGDDGGGSEELKSRRLPTSCFWVEVWCPQRRCFVAVNPCRDCSTLWGAPYSFSCDGAVIVDVTPRYSSKFSAAFAFNRRLGRCRQFGFLWRDRLAWDDNREVSEVLLHSFCVPAAHLSARQKEQLERERRQLEALTYAEPVPTTLNALHHHPLFVIESDLARHEGIYPKDSSTIVGSVKGRTVYKRSAVVSLRSRDGWLREKRGVIEGETAYKTMPPPSSRPFAAPSLFFGIWQTEPFVPLPLHEDGTLALHGRTAWYILLDQPAPPGIVHLTQPQIGRVARRMQLHFGLAVTGFVRRRVNEHRRGHWEAVIDGIVVPEAQKDKLVRAYEEWIQLVQEQEAAKRRDRAYHWWLLFTQRILAMDRLQAQYLRGKAHGSLPTR